MSSIAQSETTQSETRGLDVWYTPLNIYTFSHFKRPFYYLRCYN